MTPTQQAALEQFQAACDALKAADCAVVACVITYRPETHFSTRISVPGERPETVDHVILDAIREISSQWSEIAH
jgi:hypothetical protein